MSRNQYYDRYYGRHKDKAVFSIGGSSSPDKNMALKLESLPSGPKKVSVLMSVGKAYRWLSQAVSSVLRQELPPDWSLEILIGVDGDSASMKEAKKISDPRVKVFFIEKPVGTYVVANTLLQHATGIVIGRSDADDVMLPKRLYLILKNFDNPVVGMANTYRARTDERLNIIEQADRAADGVWFFRREVFDRLGGWRAWPTAADTDLVCRAKMLVAAKVVPLFLYLHRSHGGQISNRANINDLRSGYKAKILKTFRDAERVDPVVSEVRSV